MDKATKAGETERELPKGRGTREQPLCYAYRNDLGYVPIIEFQETSIIWDDGQITRELPPNEAFESDEYNLFDFTKPIYQLEQLVMLKFAEEIKRYITETAHYIPHASVEKKCLGCRFAKRRDKILKELSKFSA